MPACWALSGASLIASLIASQIASQIAALETARQLGEWLEADDWLCPSCPHGTGPEGAMCNTTPHPCEVADIAIRAWLEGRDA